MNCSRIFTPLLAILAMLAVGCATTSGLTLAEQRATEAREAREARQTELDRKAEALRTAQTAETDAVRGLATERRAEAKRIRESLTALKERADQLDADADAVDPDAEAKPADDDAPILRVDLMVGGMDKRLISPITVKPDTWTFAMNGGRLYLSVKTGEEPVKPRGNWSAAELGFAGSMVCVRVTLPAEGDGPATVGSCTPPTE